MSCLSQTGCADMRAEENIQGRDKAAIARAYRSSDSSTSTHSAGPGERARPCWPKRSNAPILPRPVGADIEDCDSGFTSHGPSHPPRSLESMCSAHTQAAKEALTYFARTTARATSAHRRYRSFVAEYGHACPAWASSPLCVYVLRPISA